MRNHRFMLACAALLGLGTAGLAIAQDTGGEPPAARQQLQRIHAPQSIDQAVARFTKDLELTPDQAKQVRSLAQQHHDKIQALLDKNPNASRQELSPQIHAISAEFHSQVHALLNDHQRTLEQQMVHQRMR